jgi:hypothetical protein
MTKPELKPCPWEEDEYTFDDDMGEPVGSCDLCDCNIYEEEDDGSGLCDQCQFYVYGWRRTFRKVRRQNRRLEPEEGR